MEAWLKTQSSVVREVSPPNHSLDGLDNKPSCLLKLLGRGVPEMIWIDSDLIIINEFVPWLETLPPDSIVVAEDPKHLPHRGVQNRTVAWGLSLGRDYRFTVNSCFLRVTTAPRTLLSHWRELLRAPACQQAKNQEMILRPFHLSSDQDVLGALLGSAAFASLCVVNLRTDRHIVHSGGLLMDRLGDRFRRLWGPPPLLVHAISLKPWHALDHDSPSRGFNWWLLRLAQEVSEYVAHARSLQPCINMPCPWLNYRTIIGRFLRLIGLGNDFLRGLPLAVTVSIAHALKFRRRQNHE
ncbi:MAG: hypothetical protein J6386_18865 [Candidatus Synoicihabitans palmerolidicus]|nr:hypothetical protein [Candidatus Synoicihabitans palmerolidicus]